MNLIDLNDKMVAVLGYGQEGKAVTKYLHGHGIRPVLFDSRPWEEWNETDQEDIKHRKLNFIFGDGYLHELRGFNVAFRSPGLWRRHPRLLEEEQRGLQITSQTEWFFEHCPAMIVGVTGTKGKGTTSALIAAMLKRGLVENSAAKKGRVYLTGNITQIDPFEFLDELRPEDRVVFELSSFQLQDLDRSPRLAVALMITSEHLDTHASLQEYREAKQQIVRHQRPADFAVINQDYPASLELADLTPAKIYFISRRIKVERGCYVNPEGCFMAVNLPGVADGPLPLTTADLKLIGPHNWENVAAALTASVVAGAAIEHAIVTAKDFPGLPHRLEFVGRHNGISFYNDSLSTTPESTLAAISSFNQPLVVILGGSKKKSDYSELASAIIAKKNIKALAVIGATAPEILENLRQAGNFLGELLTGATSMSGIFKQIKSAAAPGDVVLLSPACASFGMFKNYADRGNQFKQHVAQWN